MERKRQFDLVNRNFHMVCIHSEIGLLYKLKN